MNEKQQQLLLESLPHKTFYIPFSLTTDIAMSLPCMSDEAVSQGLENAARAQIVCRLIETAHRILGSPVSAEGLGDIVSRIRAITDRARNAADLYGYTVMLSPADEAQVKCALLAAAPVPPSTMPVPVLVPVVAKTGTTAIVCFYVFFSPTHIYTLIPDAPAPTAPALAPAPTAPTTAPTTCSVGVVVVQPPPSSDCSESSDIDDQEIDLSAGTSSSSGSSSSSAASPGRSDSAATSPARISDGAPRSRRHRRRVRRARDTARRGTVTVSPSSSSSSSSSVVAAAAVPSAADAHLHHHLPVRTAAIAAKRVFGGGFYAQLVDGQGPLLDLQEECKLINTEDNTNEELSQPPISPPLEKKMKKMTLVEKKM